ncbi:MAG TPA: helix-turn-helix domain-containing protein [Microthrixaceae bacterium]|nr:helix-turn-helix domain-containing protein [Microthrixaceae bacterium]
MSSHVTTDGREVRSRGLNTRARLLEAATEVFAAQGYHSARVDDIVEVAATSHGTFYVYFASKEALFDELVAEVGAEMAALVDDLPEIRSGTAQERAELRRWLERFSALFERSGAVLRMWTEVESANVPAGAAGSDLLHHLADELGRRMVGPPTRRGRKAGVGSAPAEFDPSIAALAVMAMIERFHYYASTRQLRGDRDELLDTLGDLIVRALVG